MKLITVILAFLVCSCTYMSATADNNNQSRIVADANENYDIITNDSDANPWPKMLKPQIGEPSSIGFYSGGCFTGGKDFPISGANHEIMRPSRNRFYGHQQLFTLLNTIGAELGKDKLLIGDMSQPRGGPTRTGHASHQLGIEADVWIQPLSFHTKSPITDEQRETFGSVSVLTADWKKMNYANWVPEMEKVIIKTINDPMVDRIFVNAVMKKHFCEKYPNLKTINKIRPWYYHDSHFHVRMKCPTAMKFCVTQDPIPADSGCAAKDLDWWLSDEVIDAQLKPKQGSPPRQSKIPKACRAVLK